MRALPCALAATLSWSPLAVPSTTLASSIATWAMPGSLKDLRSPSFRLMSRSAAHAVTAARQPSSTTLLSIVRISALHFEQRGLSANFAPSGQVAPHRVRDEARPRLAHHAADAVPAVAGVAEGALAGDARVGLVRALGGRRAHGALAHLGVGAIHQRDAEILLAGAGVG